MRIYSLDSPASRWHVVWFVFLWPEGPPHTPHRVAMSQHRMAPRALSASKPRASITHWDWDENPDALSSAEYLAAKGRRASIGGGLPLGSKGWRRVAT
jgi:hypothetical protein